MSPQAMTRLVTAAFIIFAVAVLGNQVTYIVPPGYRGVQVTLGKVSPDFKPEGFGLKPPFISTIQLMPVRQRTIGLQTTCISKDLQEIEVAIKVLYRIPETSTVQIFQQYKGDPFRSLVMPRVDEALKEVTKETTAQETVQQRGTTKVRALEIAQKKVGDIIKIVDLVVEDISLSEQLETAIEQKMVQEQNANKAIFEQQQAKIDAETQVIIAKGEAESIRIRGEALVENPTFIDLKIIEAWDGKTPKVVGEGASGPRILLPATGKSNALAPN